MPTDDPFENDRRAELEARITALLLGEYEGSVAADLQEAIDADPELRALRDRLTKTIGLLDAVAKPAVELPLDDERRQSVLARFKEPVPELAKPAEELQPTQTADIESAQPWFNKWARPIGLAACLGGLLIAGVFSLLQSFTQQERSTVAVMASLEEVDEEKAHWAWGDDAEGGERPTQNESHRFGYLDPGDPDSSPTPSQDSKDLTFSLEPGAPVGVSIDEKTWVIEWNGAGNLDEFSRTVDLALDNTASLSATYSIVPENPTVRDDWGFDSDRTKKWSENIRRSLGRELARPTPGRSTPTSGSTALYLPQSQPAPVSDQSLPVFAAANDGADIDQLSDKIGEPATANNSQATLSGSAVNFTDSSIDGVALQGRDLAMGTTPPTTTSDDFAKAPEVFFDADFDHNGQMAAGFPVADPAGPANETRNTPITLFARNGNHDEFNVNLTDVRKPMDGGGQNLAWGVNSGNQTTSRSNRGLSRRSSAKANDEAQTTPGGASQSLLTSAATKRDKAATGESPLLGDLPLMGRQFRSNSQTGMGGGMGGGGGMAFGGESDTSGSDQAGDGFVVPRVSVTGKQVAQASSPAGSPGVPARRFGRGGGTPPEPAAGTAALRSQSNNKGFGVNANDTAYRSFSADSFNVDERSGVAPIKILEQESEASELTFPATDKGDTAALIQDGKMLYEMRLLDESKKKLKEAIEKDPNAKPAYYYLSLIQEEEYGEDARKRDAMQKDRLASVNDAWKKGRSIKSKALPEPNPYFRTNTVVTKTRDTKPVEKPAPAPKPAKPLPRPKPNPIVATKQNRFSTFSLNVSDVSYKLAAASLEQGRLPDPGSVRSEEFVNAFDYRDPAPTSGEKLAFAWERARNPFAHNNDLIRFSVQTAAAGRDPGRALNLVVLLDNSGSMERVDRVMIVRQALRVLSQQLTDADTISVVAFARTPRLVVDGLAGNRTDELLGRVLNLNPQGGTNLEAAMDLAYATAQRHFSEKGNNRVILLTDGAANLGNVDPAALKRNVEGFRGRGVALDCFGIGWDGYNDAMLETLSRNGDGRYGFLNRPETVNAEFADQLAGALRVAAKNVKAQIEFNPSRVISWRQIGYEKHQLKKEQFRDNKVDAAEIGAAESGTALYSIQVDPNGTGPIGVARIRFLNPATGVYEEKSWPLAHEKNVPSLDKAAPSMRLSASAAMFAEWLAQSPYAAGVSPEALANTLDDAAEQFAPDARPAGLADMIRQARLIGAP